MKLLAHIKVLVIGPLVTGFCLAVGFALFVPIMNPLSDALIGFSLGLVIGLTLCAPIAAAFAFGPRLARWLDPHGFRIQWGASLLMMAALGYWLGALRGGRSDPVAGFCLVILFLCAMLKLVMAIAFQTRGGAREGSRGGNHGGRPPSAPVLRPPGGRPPVLSAAEPLPQETF
jgi:hypothetical protein